MTIKNTFTLRKAMNGPAGRDSTPLSDFEQEVYDKIGSGEYPGEQYNPKTRKWEPLK